MIVEDEDFQSQPLLNTEKVKKLIFLYKFPLSLGLIGILLLILAIGLLVRTQISTADVVFTTSASPSAQTRIRVDIEGAVISPGVYELTERSRVADALTIAGGLSAEADREWVTKNLNRAAKLVDGGKIYIPSAAETASGKFEARNSKSENNLSDSSNLLGVTTNLVNVNSASQAELEGLPGIGPVTAGKIIAGRPYQTLEELKTRKIIGSALFEKIKDLLTVY